MAALKATIVVLSLLQARPAARPYTIAYTIAMPDMASHLYAVTLTASGLTGRPVDLQMPVWSPGRYGRMDFAKNVQEFSVSGSDGKPLRWTKINGSLWRVFPGASRSMRVTYRVFADAPMSGTFSVLDSAHANWNGASLFMYVEGHKQDPVSLVVTPPENWTIMNGAVTTAGQRRFQFPNYDLLIDTPTEVAPAGSLMLDSFVVDNRTYRVMVHHNGPVSAATRERFVRNIEKIVRYENSVFGAPPLQEYTFLFNIGFPGGDGMEHLYSTQVQSRRFWSDTATFLAGTGSAAHEYFHVWNVKRVRPAALGPFDYTREQYEPSLWVAEGWTQYYGEVTLFRAGIEDTAAFYRDMAGLIHENLTAPGRKEVSARMSSFHAVLGRRAAGTADECGQYVHQLLPEGCGDRDVPRPIDSQSHGQRQVSRRRVQQSQAARVERAQGFVLSPRSRIYGGRRRAGGERRGGRQHARLV